ncbi:MAG: M20/M25/M40 family metallo-hydrolase [Nitrososphaerota archaeon]
MDELGRKLMEAVKSDDLLIKDLDRLVGQPSVSATGEGMDKCAALMRELLERDGFDVRVQRSGTSPHIILAKLSKPKPAGTIILYNHYDVQPPDPLEEWLSQPFKLVERDNLLYGRGVADNKGDIAARLAAVRALRKTLGEVPVSMTWVIEGEEEIGSPNLGKFVKENAHSLIGDICFWEGGDVSHDGRPNFYLGVKGMLYVEAEVKTASADRHSMYAPILPNPAEMISHLIAGLKDGRGRVRVSGFYKDVKRPSKRERMLLTKIPLDLVKLKQSLGATMFLERSPRKALEKLVFDPTCNVAGLHSGYSGPGAKTIVPSSATVKIDFRLVPDQNPEKVLLLLKRYMNRYGNFNLKVHSLSWPVRTDPDHKAVLHSVNAARIVYGSNPLVWPSMFGTGPVYLFARLGIPSAMLNCVAYQGSNLHSPNENISLQHLHLSAAHMALTFYNIAKGGSGPAS